MMYFDVLHNKATIKRVPTFKDDRPYMTSSYGLNSHLDTVAAVLCNKCQANIAEIFQESGEFCLHCWQDRTYPNP